LFRDAKLLIEEELPEPTRYLLVLEAIAYGKTKLSEISNYTKISMNKLPYYLNVLRNLGFIVHEKPIFEKRKGIYKISDKYMNFWFRFISPFFEEIEAGLKENAINSFKKNFNTYLGNVFEDVCKEFIIEAKIFNFTKLGKWWHKDKEIDIVALNEHNKEILFCECKWQSKVNAEKLCKELAEKAQHVQWNNEKRKEYFAIFARSFSKRIEEFEGRKVFCFDLRDLEKSVEKKRREEN
jgi:AAA+ ATPase superfamily predicted ATPase